MEQIAPTNNADYDTLIRHYNEHIQRYKLPLSFETMEKYIYHLLKMDTFALSTIRKMKFSLLEGIRATYKNDEMILAKYERQFKTIKLPTLDQSIKEHEIPTDEDIQVLLTGGKYIDTRFKPGSQEKEIIPSNDLKVIIKTLNNTGMRIHELIRLRRDKCKIKKERTYIKIHGKGDKWRENFIPTTLFNEILKTFPRHDLIFYNEKFGEIQSIDKIKLEQFEKYINKYRKRILFEINNLSVKLLQKSITPHDFRHKFATDMLKQGASLKAIAKWLGHASTETTNKFYVSDDLSNDELEKIWIK